MQNGDWKTILNTINNEINFAQIFNQTENNIIDIIKSKLRKNHPDTYNKWQISDFDVNYLFSFQEQHIYNKCTLLHISAYYGLENIVNALLKLEKIDVHTTNKYRVTPLHWAAISGNAGVVRALLENRANIDAIDQAEATPLHWAVKDGYISTTKVLLENGANPLLKDKYNHIPRNLTRNDYIEQLLKRAEKRRLFKPRMIGITVACSTAALGSAIVAWLMIRRNIAIKRVPITLALTIIAIVALVAGNIAYRTFKPSTKVNVIQTVRRRNSEAISAV
ncbi:ankyrin repeat domain-containing protein [Wolbachia endosymbiont of Pentalonia nigronervosa]|jgi:ankyrin repeat protein|uniref:ankyrin repeat domain-containing protein n=1 Tax=Wolbachia endosymbiont of Pentalonia nigronervosa TaxID=1301914 RepID=UPI00165EF662|nr:ankyrin repeat domain-containing protein [Wolbachia endosymbiont of Pentalonia nigronervosa]MBD0391016.1 ankyrin repeat domain-containing protein [Wolbachia endosymbiont of Pentalonia nigronervosa]